MAWREWVRTVEIEPSIYAADFAHLGDQIQSLLNAGVRVFHFDIGDGHFIPPVTIGPIVLRSIAPMIHRMDGRIDCHLMVDDPPHHFQEIAESGGDSVTFHVEVVDDVGAVIAEAREHGSRRRRLQARDAGRSRSRGREPRRRSLPLHVDQPGYSGQEFLAGSEERIARTRELVDCFVQVDGGVNQDNIRRVREAGADLLIVGNGIFSQEDLPRAYRRLVQALT